MNLLNIGIITAAFVANDAKIGDDNKITESDVILYGLAGSLLGGIFTYIWGFFLRKYYVSKYGAFRHDTHGLNENQSDRVDHYLNQANYYLYIFYFLTFVWAWGGGWLFIWQMSYINPMNKIGVTDQSNRDRSLYWMASFFIAVGFDWIAFDLILAVMAVKIKLVKNIVKWKGYLYDEEICHSTYRMLVKRD